MILDTNKKLVAKGKVNKGQFKNALFGLDDMLSDNGIAHFVYCPGLSDETNEASLFYNLEDKGKVEATIDLWSELYKLKKHGK